jgi:hypothetical protein
VSDRVSPSNARAHQHLEEHAAERPDVRALVDRLSTRLLRTHIRAGPPRGEAVNDPERRRPFVQEARAASALHHVTRHAADDYEPSFSPDGTLIAFSSQRQGQQAGIYVVPTLSGEERQVVARGRRPRSVAHADLPRKVQPFHHGQVRSMPLWQPGAAGSAIGGNTVVFSMTRASGNIWLISLAT